MHGFDAGNGEAVACHHADRGRYRYRLVSVVHVKNARGRGRGCSRDETDLGAVGCDGDSRRLGSQTVGVVHLVGIETCNHADVGTLIRAVRLRVTERTGRDRKVASQSVVIAGRQRQVAVVILHALLVHDRIAECHVVVVTRRTSDCNNERALVRCDVQNGTVDVGRELLLSGIAEAAFLQRVAQFLRVQLPSRGLGEAERGRHGKLRHVVVVRRNGRADSAIKALRNVRHRTPDGVACALHRCAIGGVDVDVTAQNERILEAFENVLERYDFLFRKCIRHFRLLLLLLPRPLVGHDLRHIAGLECLVAQSLEC